MSEERTLFLIDGNLQRRAAICYTMAGSGVYIEPFENTQELRAFGPRAGVVMVEDGVGKLDALLEHMAAQDRWLPLICFSESPTPQRVAQAVLDGATGYVAWPCTAVDLVAAVVAAEENSERVSSLKVRRTIARSRLERLTRRERQVLDAITEGLSNREIAERLVISPRTVEIHRANMLNKIGAHHTSEAIRIAIEASIVGQA